MPLARVAVDDPYHQQQGGDLQQPGFRSKSPAGDQLRSAALYIQQAEKAGQPADREAKNGTLEEIPADVQANGQPELARAQVAVRQEQPGGGEPEDRHHRDIGVQQVPQGKQDGGSYQRSGQAQAGLQVLQPVAAAE